MAKGQQRSNREAKKPKKSTTAAVPANATIASMMPQQRPAPKPAKK